MMYRLILTAGLLSSIFSVTAQSLKNNDNLKLLIKDSTALARSLAGDYPHPAIEIASKKDFSLSERKNYPIKISIDPGHVATNKKEALIEERYINSQSGFFYESELNLATSLVLKKLLEERGFQVMLTRGEKETALGKPYLKWYKKEFKKRLTSDLNAGKITATQYSDLINASPKDVFHKYFKDLDFKERSAKINSFDPDITIIIHYNSTEFNNDNESYAPVTDFNYSVAFVAGGFTYQELTNETQMDDFIRLASTDAIDKSIILSNYVVKEFEDKLGAKRLLPTDKHDLWFLSKYSVYTQKPGIYSRNLYLTRTVKSPMVYGECFLQNNRKEIELLSDRSYKIGGLRTSNRVKDVADAYYAGIIKYFQYMKMIQD